MPHKVVIPDNISKLIGKLPIGRELKIQLLTHLHHDLPANVDKFRSFRVPDDDRSFVYRVILSEDGKKHLFTVAVDDTTAPEHLILVDLRHSTKDDF